MGKIKQAELLARFVHLNQKRSDGEDYINHCQRIVSALRDSFSKDEGAESRHLTPLTIEQENIICAAWLHDVLEDDLHQGVAMLAMCTYFEGKVDKLVNTLTRKGYESYNEYIERVATDSEALQIKWLDMIDNTSYPIPPKQKEKYRDACTMLLLHNVPVPAIILERLGIEE